MPPPPADFGVATEAALAASPSGDPPGTLAILLVLFGVDGGSFGFDPPAFLLELDVPTTAAGGAYYSASAGAPNCIEKPRDAPAEVSGLAAGVSAAVLGSVFGGKVDDDEVLSEVTR